MTHARLDRKTRRRLLCGGHQGQCPGEFGFIIDDPYGQPRLYTTLMVEVTERMVERCPRCGEPNVLDLWELRPVGAPAVPPTL